MQTFQSPLLPTARRRPMSRRRWLRGRRRRWRGVRRIVRGGLEGPCGFFDVGQGCLVETVQLSRWLEFLCGDGEVKVKATSLVVLVKR